jgi:hypothetical protein
MTLHPSLAARVVEGARAGSLILTLDESRDLLDHLADHPHASVATPLGVLEIRELPVHVLADPPLDPCDPVDEWTRQIVASFAEGLIDADDVERLWRRN